MDILSHPERADTSGPNTPRAQLVEGSVHCSADGEHAWTAIGKFTAGHGWDIDVRRDGALVAMRTAAWGERTDGLEVVSETLAAVADGRAIGHTWFL